MDEFDGIGRINNYIYNRLDIISTFFLNYHPNYTIISAFIIQRCPVNHCVGYVTMTDFKTNLFSNLDLYLKEQLTDDVIALNVNTDKPFLFNMPYHLRAQNSHGMESYGIVRVYIDEIRHFDRRMRLTDTHNRYDYRYYRAI